MANFSASTCVLRSFRVSTILLLTSGTAFSQVLYNIDFNAPAQPVNQIVRTGSAPGFVSSINFGTPLVVSSFGSLVDQPLRLDMAGNDSPFYYDQIQLNLPQTHPNTMDLAFDFTSSGLIGSHAQLAVVFDTPSVRNIYFGNDGTISLWAPFLTQTSVGNFSNGEAFRFDAHLDFINNRWTMYKNGVLLGGAFFQPDSYVQAIRFSYGIVSAGQLSDSSAVAIDNIVVTVPEPAHLAAVLCPAFLFWLALRNRSRLSRSARL